MSDITVVVPTSPIPIHPGSAILRETVDSVRHHLPDAEIFLCFDGVRPEQAEMQGDYDEYTRRALWHADHEWGNVCPFVFDQHLHQSGMMHKVLPEISTPLLLFVEHDTPLVTDAEIDWRECMWALKGGVSNLVRFHHEAAIPDEHQHMMHGPESLDAPSGEYWPLMRTSQWSQRPHLATTALYHRVMGEFSPDSRSFIEDRMHGVVDEGYRRHGLMGWNPWRLHIYHPEEGSIKRSYHLDGRAGGPKYDDTQVY